MKTYHTAGIGGWLILPMIGLFITPVRLGYTLVTVHIPVILSGSWGVLTTPGSAAYHPLWGPLLLFEVFGNTILMCWAVVLLILLFTKSYLFPRWIILFYLASLAIIALDMILCDFIPAVAEQNDPTAMKQLVRSLISSAIWIPYFMKSERVKYTFIKPSDQVMQSEPSDAGSEAGAPEGTAEL